MSPPLLPSSLTTMSHSLSKPTAAATTTTTTATTLTNKLNNTATNKKPSSNPNPNWSSSLCEHSPSATLDILIMLLVLFSGAFLISSYLSYIFHSLSLLLPPISLSSFSSLSLFSLFLSSAVLVFELCLCGIRSRRCGKSGCKGLKNAMEFDLQLQNEECLKSAAEAVKVVDELPWKGGTEGNPDYELLRTELRKMAPVNGRAVLLFRAKCGCPVAKLEGWNLKRGRKNKKSLALNGGDHC